MEIMKSAVACANTEGEGKGKTTDKPGCTRIFLRGKILPVFSLVIHLCVSGCIPGSNPDSGIAMLQRKIKRHAFLSPDGSAVLSGAAFFPFGYPVNPRPAVVFIPGMFLFPHGQVSSPGPSAVLCTGCAEH